MPASTIRSSTRKTIACSLETRRRCWTKSWSRSRLRSAEASAISFHAEVTVPSVHPQEIKRAIPQNSRFSLFRAAECRIALHANCIFLSTLRRFVVYKSLGGRAMDALRFGSVEGGAHEMLVDGRMGGDALGCGCLCGRTHRWESAGR